MTRRELLCAAAVLATAAAAVGRPYLPGVLRAPLTSPERAVRDYLRRSAVYDDAEIARWRRVGEDVELTYELPGAERLTEVFLIRSGRVVGVYPADAPPEVRRMARLAAGVE